MRSKQILFCLSVVFIFAFMNKYLWESLHGYSLYADHIIDSDKYVQMMIYMSFMDAMMILVLYLACAVFVKDVLWLKEVNSKRTSIFFVLGLFIGIVAEYWAVYVSHEWHYNARMPLIFGIGLSPLVQLGVTGVLSLWITKKLTWDGC